MDVFDRHEKIAYQLSGGKDSMAGLWLLADYWDQMTVYWMDTGDAVPETRQFVEEIFERLPHTKVIKGDVQGFWETMGWPSDLMPADFTLFGQLAIDGRAPLISSREACCVSNLMAPMAQQMKEDGITLVIRGQKKADKMKSQLRSGDWEDGIEYFFPLEDWTDEDVFKYIDEYGVPCLSYYNQMNASLDCLHCTAYWEEGRGPFLKENHPEAYEEVKARMEYIGRACQTTLNSIKLFDEVPHGSN